MGRQSEGPVWYRGQQGLAKLLLESDEIICRGQIKARLPRSQITAWAAEGEDLILTTQDGPLSATLGAKEAAAWLRALDKPGPTLAEKLGLSERSRAFVPVPLLDYVLGTAVQPFLVSDIAGAALAIAELRSAEDLNAALAMIGALPLWGVTVKGKASPYGDADLRLALRALEYVDTKSCAVSAEMTATRWQKRAPAQKEPFSGVLKRSPQAGI
jgi:hypothetical protein